MLLNKQRPPWPSRRVGPLDLPPRLEPEQYRRASVSFPPASEKRAAVKSISTVGDSCIGPHCRSCWLDGCRFGDVQFLAVVSLLGK